MRDGQPLAPAGACRRPKDPAGSDGRRLADALPIAVAGYLWRMGTEPIVRHAVRVLLLDECDSLLLFRAEDPQTGVAFWFPAGGGVEDGEDIESAAKREIAEETGLRDLCLGSEVWRRRHVFTWRGAEFDQRERWFVARVARFEPDGHAMTATEKLDLKECRWWTPEELEATSELLTPRDLARRLRSLLTDGPPRQPVEVGV